MNERSGRVLLRLRVEILVQVQDLGYVTVQVILIVQLALAAVVADQDKVSLAQDQIANNHFAGDENGDELVIVHSDVGNPRAEASPIEMRLSSAARVLVLAVR